MTCVPAASCKGALEEATRRWPNRGRASDGVCASSLHLTLYPVSDHNVGEAFDLTADLAHEVDCSALVAELVDRRDPRVKYVIWNRTIWRSYDRPATRTRRFLRAWTPEPYTGPDPHTNHMHVSILHAARNVLGPWWIAGLDQEHDDMTDEEHQWLAEMHHELVNPNSATQQRLAHIETNTAWIKQRLVDEQQGRG